MLEQTGSAAAVAGLLVFSFAPMVLFLLIGGVTVDRYPPLRLMLASDVVRGVSVATVAALAATDRLGLPSLYGLSLVFGVVDAFFQPAYAAAVPTLVPDGDLPSANALSSWSSQIGRVIGPVLGAGVVAAGGTSLAFALNAVTFGASAAFLLPLLGHQVAGAPRSPETPSPPTVLEDMRTGVSTVWRSSWLRLTIAAFAFTNVALAGPYGVAMPFLISDRDHGVGTLGLLYTMFPIGYVIGGAWLGRRSRVDHRGATVYGGLAVAGAMLCLFGLPVPLTALGLAALVNGAALEMGNLAWVSTLQDPAIVPRDQLGRVTSIDMLGSFALLPVGYALAGWATDEFGAAEVFLVGGGATAVLTSLGLLVPTIRRVD